LLWDTWQCLYRLSYLLCYSAYVPQIVGKTRIRNVGVAALAREVGLAEPTVTVKLNRGMTPDQIRAQQAEKRGIGAGGLTDSEKGRSGPTAPKQGERGESRSSYVPPNQRRRPGVRPRPLPPDLPPKPAHTYAPPSGKLVAEVPTANGHESFYQARERKEIALADEKEFRVRQMQQELVPVVQMNAWMSGNILKARDIGLRIGPELRDRLAAETDPVECERMVAAEVERMLEALRTFPVEEAMRMGMGSSAVEEADGEVA
jgi:hypothetical protein